MGEKINKEICTVDSLKKILNELSDLGYGNMPILLGTDTPLLKDSICISYMENKLRIHNTYYDEQLADFASKLKDSVSIAIRTYIMDCYDAGLMRKED